MIFNYIGLDDFFCFFFQEKVIKISSRSNLIFPDLSFEFNSSPFFFKGRHILLSSSKKGKVPKNVINSTFKTQH